MRANYFTNRVRWLVVSVLLASILGCSARQLPSPQPEPVEIQFRRALQNGTIDEVSSLLHEHPELANRKDQSGRVPLEAVLLSNRPDLDDLLRVLFDAGADVNVRSQFSDETPLMISATRGNPSAMSVLLANGANVGARDSHGRTALDLATYMRHLDVARLLITSGCKETLLDAAFLGDAKTADEILRANPASINERGTMPRVTPFEAALLRQSQTGDDAVVTVMLKYKPQLSIFDAAALGRIDLLRGFASGSPILLNSIDEASKTPLDWALLEHQLDAAKFLLDHGAVPSTEELIDAIRKSDEDAVRLLVDHNVAKDDLIPGEGTPYQIAMRLGKPDYGVIEIEQMSP